MTVEEDDVTIFNVTLDNVANAQVSSHHISITKLEIDLVAAFIHLDDALCSWPDIRTILDALPELGHILALGSLGVCKVLGDKLGDGDLIDTQVGIGRNDSSTRKVDTFTRQVTTESTPVYP